MIEMWKVCQHINGRLLSAWSPHRLCLEYGVGILTEPLDGTGLFAFEDEDYARVFQKEMLRYASYFVLLRGYGEPGPPLPVRAIRPENVDVALVIWKFPLSFALPTFQWPEGTVSAAWFVGEEVIG